MGHIPAEWQARLGGDALTGVSGLSVIGRGSTLPSLFAFSTSSPAGSGVLLTYYPEKQRPAYAQYGAFNQYQTHSDQSRGVAFPEGTRSVLVFGRHGDSSGKYNLYGFGTDNVSLHGTVHSVEGGVTNHWAYDPEHVGVKGEHAYPYVAYVWAYDAADLAEVKAGRRQPWEVLPYAVWELPGAEFLSVGRGADTRKPDRDGIQPV